MPSKTIIIHRKPLSGTPSEIINISTDDFPKPPEGAKLKESTFTYTVTASEIILSCELDNPLPNPKYMPSSLDS